MENQEREREKQNKNKFQNLESLGFGRERIKTGSRTLKVTGDGQGEGDALDLSFVSGSSTELIRIPLIGIPLRATELGPEGDGTILGSI